MHTVFGNSVECRYIDIDRDDLGDYPIIRKLREKGSRSMDLPVVMLDDRVYSSGRLYPTRIIEELTRMGLSRVDRKRSAR